MKQILDLGAGDRVNSGATHAIDLHRRTEPGVQYLALNAERNRFPLQDNSFDLVISRGALLVAFGNLHTYREIFRILKPGGKLVFMFGEYPSVGSWPRAYLDMKIAGFTNIRKKVSHRKTWGHKASWRTVNAFKPEYPARVIRRIERTSLQTTFG